MKFSSVLFVATLASMVPFSCILSGAAPAPVPRAAAAVSSALQKGIEEYERRAEGAVGLKADPKRINASTEHFKEALKDPATHDEAAYRLMQTYYYQGTFTTDDDKQKKAIYSEGRKLAEEMEAKFPKEVKYKYWLFIELGLWSEAYGKLQAAKEGIAGRLRDLCEAIITIDPTYEEGGGDRFCGRLHHQAPGILFWPSNKKAIKHLRNALKYGPNQLSNNLFLAEVLLDEGQKEEAKTLLTKVAKATANPAFLLEQTQDINRANELLKDLN